MELLKSQKFHELSLKNHFDFIDMFKSLQNSILKEKDITKVRLKFDEIC